jgi:trk system potassium uptake protein TrkH
LIFETISALGTVGLSTGITSQLSVLGQLSMIVAMFVGRLGSLVIAMTIGRKDVGQAIRFPEQEVVVG